MAEKRICEVCGKEFEATHHSRIYCSPECRYIKQKSVAREYNQRKALRRQAMQAQSYIPGSKGKRKRTAEPPKDEFTLEGKSISRLAREAKAFRMDYGAYTDKIRHGTIEEHLKREGITDWKTILRELE